MSRIRGVKGMNDILPDRIALWHRVEDTVREVFSRYGYAELRTPIVEETRLFARSIGESTDIVGKEMYTFTDRKGRTSLSLRPEGTASAVRAYVEHSVHVQEPVTRWWYRGPMYRYERVQAGRYRQFHQIGAEAFGAAEPALDAELLVMIDRLLRVDLGVEGVTLRLNSLGDPEDRPAYLEALKGHLGAHVDALCEDCRRRLETNPLRTLDCKVQSCQPILEAAPRIGDHLGEAARAHFDAVLALLDGAGVVYELVPRLVRGLDYYNRTAFEFVAGSLGAQNAVCGGGRYDSLVKALGGPDVPAIGFAMGVERLLQLLGGNAGVPSGPELAVVVAGATAFPGAFQAVERLRAHGLRVDLDPRQGSVKSQMRRADKLGAPFVVVLGDDELASGRVQLKPMAGGEPEEVALGALAARLLDIRRHREGADPATRV